LSDLEEYLNEAKLIEFDWHSFDCCAFPANWIVKKRNVDPMARWRNQYNDEASARAFISSSGGLTSLWLLGMSDAGLYEQPDIPIAGDVGVLNVPCASGMEEIGGIFTGKRWSMLSPNGIFCASVDPVMIWRV
jgi:hypothetical protein